MSRGTSCPRSWHDWGSAFNRRQRPADADLQPRAPICDAGSQAESPLRFLATGADETYNRMGLRAPQCRIEPQPMLRLTVSRLLLGMGSPGAALRRAPPNRSRPFGQWLLANCIFESRLIQKAD